MPKTQTCYVIFAGPQQHGRPGTKYYAEDGTITDLKSKAATFLTREDAEDFFTQHGIASSETRYIGTEEFSENEL